IKLVNGYRYMQLIKYPDRKLWSQLLERPRLDTASLESRVLNILKEIKENGDDAVRRFSLMFDKVSLPAVGVTTAEIAAAGALVPEPLKEAIRRAKQNIELFHASQLRQEEVVETMPGIKCWRRSLPIERVGLYIPGGTAPLFSTVLML